MKRLFTAIIALAFAFNAYSQCTPGPVTGNPGLNPPPASVPCIERGVFYDFTLQFENFTSFNCSGFTPTVTSATINSMSNFPCGITWQADQSSYGPGEAGCIRIYGTTTDPVGQYALVVNMSFTLDILGQSYTVNGTIADLQTQLSQFSCTAPPVNTDYFSRVIEPGTTCLAIGAMPTMNSSGATCPPPSVSVSGGTTVCAGSSATLTANATGAAGTITYAWSQGANTQSITVSATTTTTYTVTVTASNGTATGSAIVTVNPIPLATFSVVPSGTSATITNNTTNATSYSWNFGDGQTSLVQNPPAHNYANNGTYTITLIATNSCGNDTATQQVTITGGSGPGVSISGNTAICVGASTTLTADVTNGTGTITYAWSNGQTSQAITVSPTTNTTYSVTVTDQNGSVNGSATVTVNQEPNAAFTASPSGATVTLTNTTTNATSYAWSFGDGQTSTVQSPGTHTYTGNGSFTIMLVATNSCGNDTATQQVTITGTSGPSVSITGNTTICEGLNTTLTANVTNATGGTTYAWSPGGATTQAITVSPASTTTYTVTVTATNGVASDDATVTVMPVPSAAFTATLSGGTITITSTTTGATSFDWDFGDGEASALQQPGTHTYTFSDTFTIRLIATNGCGSDTVTHGVTVIGVGINDIEANAATLKVYPNPFNTSTTVEVENISGSFDVALYTITGFKVYQRNTVTDHKLVIQKEALPQGVYFIEVSNEKTLARQKVVIY